MDGMKFQVCSLGFEDGCDVIFVVDVFNYDGIYECLIWEVFVCWGMGYFMIQEDFNN